MELKDQVVNLELSKRLKSLEIEQKSLFEWSIEYRKKDSQSSIQLMGGCFEIKVNHNISWRVYDWAERETYSAFTVAELGMLLPDKKVSSGMEQEKFNCIYGQRNNGEDMPDSEWENDKFYAFGYMCMTDNNEADVRAKMLIYLIENNFVKIKKKKGKTND